MGAVGVAGGLRASSIDTLLGRNGSVFEIGSRKTAVDINNDDNSKAFGIRATSNSDLQDFLRYWRGRSNIVQRNADNVYTRAMREATARGMSPAEARRVASAARTAAVKRAMEKATGSGTRFPNISIK